MIAVGRQYVVSPVFRRKPVAEVPEWKQRIDEARAVIRQHRDDPALHLRLDQIEAAVAQAIDDQRQLSASIVALKPDQVSGELKAALRARRDPTAPDTELIAALRRRHDTVNQLTNRLESIDVSIAGAIADVEALAARSVELSFAGSAAMSLNAELARLSDDTTALILAHDEIAQISRGDL